MAAVPRAASLEARSMSSDPTKASSPTDASPLSVVPLSNGQRQPRKTKQKRNKPTLSCRECVDHKTKCDRGRPSCLACVKRATTCQYSQIAEILAASEGKGSKSRKTGKTTQDTSPISSSAASKYAVEDGGDRGSSKCSIANITHPSSASSRSPVPQQSTRLPQSQQASRVFSLAPVDSAASHLRPLAFDPAPMSVFGMGGEHPFANYWTCKGGLAEVVGLLPRKEQADILVSKFFEVVDPLYPILDRLEFLREYGHFWSLNHEEKCKFEAATVSLHFVIYATATQYIELPSPTERTKTAEFYISAAHRALQISSYLNRMTITTVQTMVLIFYFLMNDNHVSDAWTFSGITQRQAYVLQLNREPILVAPNASIAEKNMRCKLWAAIIYQETSIALTLKLPSTSLQCDVGPHSLNYDEADQTEDFTSSLEKEHPPISALCSELTKTDLSYCKSIWAYATFLQENICRQRALGLPICQSNNHKRDMVSSFRSLYRSLPQPFGSYDPERFLDPSRRVARQQIALTQSFFHSLMLICADENVQADVIPDLYGTFEAGHEAMSAFFAMDALFGGETSGWWSFQHRAFEEAMLVANLLAADKKPLFPPSFTSGMSRENDMLVTAKKDIFRVLEIMGQNRGLFEFHAVQERRFDSLQAVYDTITVV